MMNNLFSSFDPSTSSLLSMSWLSMLFPLIFIPLMYWNIPSKIQLIPMFLLNFIMSEMKNNLNKMNLKIMIIISSFMMFILINNIMGLFPYIFTATSHMSLSLFLALPMWLTLNMFGWINMYNYMFMHLTPMGTPMMLSSFMVIIETVSNLIRPITLSVRLSANMIAGHLLLTLLSQISEQIPILLSISIIPLILLISLELAVAMIQSYVFTTLISLYITEIN